MKLASMLESMFFITLGISCVLLLMLFYHFKQRISKLEQSSETMFEILNNMVQELSSIKRGEKILHSSHVPVPMTPNAPTFSSVPTNKIQVELSEDETSLPDIIDNVNNDITDIDEDNESSEYETDTCVDSDDDEDSNNEESNQDEDSVKVVSVEIDESLDNLDISESVVSDINEDIDETEEPPVEINTDIIEEIQVNKLDEDNTLEENDNVSHSSVNTTEVYRKMNVPSLKSLVIEKGLTSDPSKMKKNDLIALLESNQ